MWAWPLLGPVPPASSSAEKDGLWHLAQDPGGPVLPRGGQMAKRTQAAAGRGGTGRPDGLPHGRL